MKNNPLDGFIELLVVFIILWVLIQTSGILSILNQ